MKIKCFLFGAVALVLGACSSEENEAPIANGEAYLQLTVKLPSTDGTRSTTDEDGKTAEGTENGQVYENNISSLQVILDDGTHSYAKTVDFSTPGNVPAAGVSVYNTPPIKVEGLVGGATYTAYVIVNGSYAGSDIKNAAIEGLTTIPGLAVTGSIAESKKFLMTGFKTMTSAIETNTAVYTKDNPLKLGEIEVERAVARIDYRQEKANNTYDVNASNPGELLVKLTDVALTNVSPSFYLFKRVSADGTNNTPGWTLGGKEVGGTTPNYVVDHNFANKTFAKWHAGTKAPFLNTFAGTTSATYTSLSSLTTEDNPWSTTEPTYSYGGYKIWTYCTENTIQADPVAPLDPNQINGLSTGVIFKGEILTTSTITKYGSTTDKAFNGNPVYVLNGILYGDWAAVLAAKTDAVPDVVSAFTAGGLNDTENSNTVAKLQTAGFTRYTPQDGHYYVYYTYWNRHNDNGKDTEMGPMEFAVVRNNVYKLAVISISGLGHPNDPTNPGSDPDPDGPDPEDPDEDGVGMFLKVSVKVMPWIEGGYGISL